MDVKLSLNDEQVKRLEEALSRPQTPFWRSDALLRTTQILAILVGGCWVLVQFILFERGRIDLELQKTAAEVKRIDLQMRLDRLEEQRRSAEFISSQSYRFAAERVLEVTYLQNLDSETALYELRYGMKLTNQSSVPFEVTMWVLDYFGGDVREDLAAEATFIEPIGYPKNRWNPGSTTGGAVAWKRLGSSGAILSEARGNIASAWASVTHDVRLTSGGGLTGVLKPAQSYHMNDAFLAKGTPGSYVAFVHSLCFERCATSENLYFNSAYTKLPGPPSISDYEAAQPSTAPDG